jgi:hypothetical protein
MKTYCLSILQKETQQRCQDDVKQLVGERGNTRERDREKICVWVGVRKECAELGMQEEEQEKKSKKKEEKLLLTRC